MPDTVVPQRAEKAPASSKSLHDQLMALVSGRGTVVVAALLIHSWVGMVMILIELGVVIMQKLTWVLVMMTALFGSEVHSQRAFRVLPWMRDRSESAILDHKDFPASRSVHHDPNPAPLRPVRHEPKSLPLRLRLAFATITAKPLPLPRLACGEGAVPGPTPSWDAVDKSTSDCAREELRIPGPREAHPSEKSRNGQ